MFARFLLASGKERKNNTLLVKIVFWNTQGLKNGSFGIGLLTAQSYQ